MLTHDFLLLPEQGDYQADYLRHISDPHAVKVADDLIRYMLDTLQWIPSINPAAPATWKGHGLNYYGPTAINQLGAAQLARIFRHWAALLQTGPEQLELTGAFEWIEDAPFSSGEYAKLLLSRDATVETLLAVAQLGETAQAGRFYVLHIGV